MASGPEKEKRPLSVARPQSRQGAPQVSCSGCIVILLCSVSHFQANRCSPSPARRQPCLSMHHRGQVWSRSRPKPPMSSHRCHTPVEVHPHPCNGTINAACEKWRVWKEIDETRQYVNECFRCEPSCFFIWQCSESPSHNQSTGYLSQRQAVDNCKKVNI